MDEVRLETRDGVALLTLAAPERRNALTVEMAVRMVELCDEIDADPAVGAVVVRAEGPVFCAGGERSLLARAGEDPAEPANFAGLSAVYRAFTRVGELEPPTIAAIAGAAVGAGMNLVLATDLRVVARGALLRSGFMQIGIHPGGGHTGILTRVAGREAASAMALFGADIDGERAAQIGLAWAAVEAEEVEPTALALAEAPGRDPELARRTARSFRTVNGPPALPWGAALDVERSAQMWSMRRKAQSG